MSEEEKMDFSIFIEYYLDDARGIFTEFSEALEELKKDHGQRRYWENARRDAHTLKGSSRMIEIFDIAELSLSCQCVLDNVLNESLEPTAEVLELLSEAKDTLEEMVKERVAERRETLTAALKERSLQLQTRLNNTTGAAI